MCVESINYTGVLVKKYEEGKEIIGQLLFDINN